MSQQEEGELPSDGNGWRFGDPIVETRPNEFQLLYQKTGGITILMQHLSLQNGQIAPCPQASPEV